jgi:hypothetical protein
VGLVTLHVRGRDIVEEVSLAMRFNKEDWRWSVVGEAAEVQRSEVRARVLAALASASPEGLNAACARRLVDPFPSSATTLGSLAR